MGLLRRKRERETERPEEPTFAAEAGPGRPRLTPVDVQQQVFRLAFRGYNEKDVDRFLDLVTEDLAALHEENKRLREELELRSTRSSAALEEARAHAEETVRRAREEAARIIERAERTAAAHRSPSGDPVPAPFLVREREFLQRLAALVQEHAEGLKAEARRAKGAEPASEPEEEAAGPGEGEGARPASVTVPEATAPVDPPPLPEEPEEDPAWPEPFADEGPADAGRADAGPADAGRADEGPAAGGADALAPQRSRSGSFPAGEEDQEPSLRELFWGEE